MVSGQRSSFPPHLFYLYNTRPQFEEAVKQAAWIYNLGKALDPGSSKLFVLSQQEETKPQAFAMQQNYPNSFNPATVVRYQLPVVSDVKLVVYDLLGREVSVLVNERKAPGSYSVMFDAAGLASGVYFYRLTAGEFVQVRKLLMLR